MFKETHGEPGEHFIQHHYINAIRSQAMPNSSSSGRVSHIFLPRASACQGGGNISELRKDFQGAQKFA